MLLGTVLLHVLCSSAVALLTSLVYLLRRALALERACPVAFAVFAVLVGVASVFGTVLVVVRLAVESQPECSVDAGCVPLAARLLLVVQRRRSHPASCCACTGNVRSYIHLGSYRTSTVRSGPAEHCVISDRPGDIHWTSASSTHR